jgi:hypothetical protein
MKNTTGENLPIRRPKYRLVLPALLAIPIILYVLLSGFKQPLTPVTDFSIIVISPTLGGLILAASGNKRIRRVVRSEFIAISQKLILATVLLIVFTSLFFTVDLLGGIDPASIKWSIINVFRWAFFWGAVSSFYPGVWLFILGIFDLVFALRHLSRASSG